MINLNKLRNNLEQYRKSLKIRGSDFDLDKFIALDHKVKKLKSKIEALNQEKNSIIKQIVGEKNNKQKKQLIQDLKLIKEKIFNHSSKSINLYSKYKSLLASAPNFLSEQVLIKSKIKIKSGKVLALKKSLNLDGLELLENRGLIKYDKKTLEIKHKKDQIVEFNQGVIHYLYNKFYKKGFEIIALDKRLENIVEESSNFAHLIAEFSKTRIDIDIIPIRRLYLSNGNDIESISLVKEQDIQNEIDFYISILSEIYDEFDMPYEVVLASARDMRASEYLRYDIDCYNTKTNKFDKLSNISSYNEYIGRKYSIRYNMGQSREFVGIVKTKIFNINDLLINIVENNYNNEMRIPIPIKMKKCINIGEI